MKRSVLLVALAFVQLATLVAQTPAPPARPGGDGQPFLLGVVRRDGVVNPFAAFDGKDWSTPWPDDLTKIELPFSFDGIPRKWWGKPDAPETLSIWFEGQSRGTLRLEQPVRMAPMCAPRIGLRSTYKSAEPLPPPLSRPYPKDGIVLSGEQRAEPIPAVARTDGDWAGLAVALSEPAEAAENSVIERIVNWEHPTPRKARKKVPLRLEALYRAPMDTAGWTAYYVEGVKEYPPGPDDEGCGLVTSVHGWHAMGPNGKHRSSLDANVTYCDRARVTFMLPFGLIRTNGRTYWVYQISGYQTEWYVVARPTSKGIDKEVDYAAGRCRGPQGY